MITVLQACVLGGVVAAPANTEVTATFPHRASHSCYYLADTSYLSDSSAFTVSFRRPSQNSVLRFPQGSANVVLTVVLQNVLHSETLQEKRDQ